MAHLFAHGLIAQDLVTFIVNGFLTPEQAKFMQEQHSVLIKNIAPLVPTLVEGLDVKEWMVFAPIAKDWAEYNKHDNRGEFVPARL